MQTTFMLSLRAMSATPPRNANLPNPTNFVALGGSGLTAIPDSLYAHRGIEADSLRDGPHASRVRWSRLLGNADEIIEIQNYGKYLARETRARSSHEYVYRFTRAHRRKRV